MVTDDDAARLMVQQLLLAGLGPSTRDVPAGVEIVVVAGQGERARRTLGIVDADTDSATDRSAVMPGFTSREGRRALVAQVGDTGGRSGQVRTFVIFGVALLVIPAVTFFITYTLASR